MTTEHMPPGQPGPGSAEVSDLDAARRSIRVQLLAQEHWSLLSTRSLSWSESFARASMFLTLLTGTVVAPSLRGSVMHALVTTPAMIAFVDCVVAAVLAGLILAQLGAGMELAAAGAALSFVVALVLFGVYSGRKAGEFWLQNRPKRDTD